MIMPLLVGLPILTLLWFRWRYAWWRPATHWSLPRILMNDMVREEIPGSRYNKLRVSPAEFEKQER